MVAPGVLGGAEVPGWFEGARTGAVEGGTPGAGVDGGIYVINY